jgi:hypothetical protein
MKRYLLVILLWFTACAPASPASTPTVVSVYATAAAQAWLSKLYDCGARQAVVVRLADTPSAADIVLRLGEPADLSTAAYQIDSEDVLVVVNPARGSAGLSAEQVRGLFSGQINDWSRIDPSKTGSVQVWVFAQGEDVEQVFEKTLAGSPVVSNARLATSPAEMISAIAADPNAIGILSRHWKTADVSEAYVLASAPVLALSPSEPIGTVKDLLACLQG